MKFAVVLLFALTSLTCFCFSAESSSLDADSSTKIEKKDISELVGKSERTLSPYFLTVIYAILFIFGGIVVYVLYKKKMLSGFGPLNSNKNIKIIETSMLGNRQFLVLAECENKRVLLGVGPGFINKLIDYSKADEEFTKALDNQMEKSTTDV